jgi:uncharacterized protein YodC (DUF2158 family)
MTDLKLGDLVVLRSGGPVMTVDAINTDIFDDGKFTGVVCAWFVGDQLQRVRFDYRAVELASPAAKTVTAQLDSGAYSETLSSMMTEMNAATEPAAPAARHGRKAPRKAARGKPNRPAPTHPEGGTA